MFSTIGLGALEQVPRAAAQAFRRTELVLVLNNSELEDPFPTRVGIALAQKPDSLPGWDWSQVEVPPLVDWLSVAGEEVGASIKSGSTFAIHDTLASWEADLLFALPAGDFLDHLSDDDTYTDADLAEAAQAHAAKDLQSLRRRPPLLRSMLFQWLESLGVAPGDPNGRAS